MNEQEHKKRAIRRFILQGAAIFVAVFVIAAIGIWNYYLPIRRMLPAVSFSAKAEGEVRIHFLDVGQGDCAVVERGDGSALIIDAGDGSWEHNNHILRYLKGLGIGSVTLVITHADSDHCGGASAILEDWGAETVYMPVLPVTMNVYDSIGRAAEKAGAEIKTLTRYDVIAGGDAYAVCISPYSVDETDINDSSAVLYFSYAGVNVLFGGDISSEREMRLLGEEILSEEIGEHLFDSGPYRVRLGETDILKVSHHGSGGSSSAEWLNLLSPATAIVSCGRGNAYGHPDGGTLGRLAEVGAEIYRTDELGDLIVTISRDGTYRTSPRIA